MEEFLFPLGWVSMNVFVACHGLAEAKGNSIQDDIDQMFVTHLGIDSQSMNIVQVFLDSAYFFDIPNLVKALSGL